MKKNTFCTKLLFGLWFSIAGWSAHAALPIQKIPLESGATLYLVETHTIPMVNIGLDIAAGGVYDPKDKIGVSDFTANLMNKGSRINNLQRDESFIDNQISDLGASVNFGSASELSTVRIKTLSRPQILDAIVDLVSNVLANPIFDPKILEREKSLEISALLNNQNKPEVMVAKQFTKMIYQNNPLGNQETVQSIKNIHIDDLKKFHQTYYRASAINVLMVGDVTKEQAIAIANHLTNHLPKGAPINLVVPPFEQLLKAPIDQREVRLDHPSQQAHILMGMTALPRNSPDYFPLLVGNYILGGGGFVSRLMNEIREKRGLAYSVSSYFIPAKYSGYFQAGMQTKKEQTNQSVELLRSTIGNFIESGPTEDEIKAAKNNLINGFPLRIDSNGKLMDNLSAITWNELPLNTLDIWTEMVNKVSREDIQRAFKNHLDMDKMVTVIVGGQ